MTRKIEIITDDVYKLATDELSNLKDEYKTAIKLQAIISSKKCGIKQVSETFNKSRTTIRNWVNKLKNGSAEFLKPKPKKTRKLIIDPEWYPTIKSWIDENPNLIIEAIKQKIEQKFKVHPSKSNVHRLLKKLKYSYITPRPTHHKQDKTLHEGFKKKSKPE